MRLPIPPLGRERNYAMINTLPETTHLTPVLFYLSMTKERGTSAGLEISHDAQDGEIYLIYQKQGRHRW